MISMQAQQKQFDLNDLTPGGKTHDQFRPADIKGAGWCGDNFIFTQGDSILTTDYAGKTKKNPLITLDRLNKALEDIQLKPLKKLPALTFSSEAEPQTATLFAENKILTYNFKKDKITAIIPYQDKDSGFDLNTDHSWVAVNQESKLFVIGQDGKRKEVSDDTNADIVWGQAVHRNEFGISKGTFWSPDGKKLAFYRMDQSMVTDYPLVDVAARTGKAMPVKYPMAGMTSHEVTVGIFHPETGKTIFLQTGEPRDHYLTNIEWTPDNQSILIAELNREQNKMDLNRYDAQTGKLMYTLFSESSEKYVEPENPPFFLPGNPDLFIWQSDRDGYNHL
ncbi:MAG: DPP IV N-terminal domain-containing protein, partial [Bacteroidales bacterium]